MQLFFLHSTTLEYTGVLCDLTYVHFFDCFSSEFFLTSTTFTTVSAVTWAVVAVGVVVALAGLASLIGYDGSKRGWWKL